MSTKPLKAPFPFFGGKGKIAPQIWQRLGNVPNYVDPFAASLAVPLACPHPAKVETFNDLDGYICNFWRAVKANPALVASYADYPVSECDLMARHQWLIDQKPAVEKLKSDPDFYDAKIAGWWSWGASCWIGQGWCSKTANQIPHLGNGGMGVHSGNVKRGLGIDGVLVALQKRLRNSRIACGDWKRVLTPTVTYKSHGLTGILLDPPYGFGNMNYAAGGNDSDIAIEVAKWAIENGSNSLLRIAYCGYEGVYDFPSNWECHAWKTDGSYGSRNGGEALENSKRERIWFSPHCLKKERSLLDVFDEDEL